MPSSNPAIAPVISIVLIVRDPNDAPDTVLDALSEQEAIEKTEIIIVDGRPGGAAPSGYTNLTTIYRAAQGENMPRLKARGAHLARGDIVAFLEPKAVPAPGWISAILAAQDKGTLCAVGGSVKFDGASDAINRAAFIFEYGAFSPHKLRSGATHDLPGNNMAIPRERLLTLCNDILDSEGLNKPFCQQRLMDGGVPIVMAPDMTITLKSNHRFWAFLESRFNYARCYGGTRIRFASKRRRAVLRVGAPAIPAILMLRHFSQMQKTEPGLLNFTAAIALAVVCLTWGAGELSGYWFGAGSACKRLY